MTLTFGSLFAGIGGLDLGFERAGLECKFQVENDPFCIKVLQKHWPHIPRYGDVRKLRGDFLPPVDLLCGGFPCQPVSTAGRRKGTGDPRWLWPEFARLVGEMGVKYVFVENVPGLLSKGGVEVIADLAEMGFDAEWGVVAASAVGAPHIRERVFVLGYAHKPGLEGEDQQRAQRPDAARSGGRTRVMADPDLKRLQRVNDSRVSKKLGQARDQSAGSGTEGQGGVMADTQVHSQRSRLRARRETGVGSGRLGYGSSANGDWWAVEPDVGRVAYGVPARVDRLRAIGNAVVPQWAELMGQMILDIDRDN